MKLRISTLLLFFAALLLAGCQPQDPEPPTEPVPPETVQEPAAHPDAGADADVFERYSEELLMSMLDRSPEWSIYAGRYDNAHRVTIPDAGWREDQRAFFNEAAARLAEFDPVTLPAELAIDHALLDNAVAARLWYLDTFRDWRWNPANYNVAGPIGLLLNTDYAPAGERMRTVQARLEQVPAYYRAARENIDRPTMEHTELALTQSRGTLGLLGEGLEEQAGEAGLEGEDLERFARVRTEAHQAVGEWVEWLEAVQDELAESGDARDFRIGEALYEDKFRYDIQSGFTAEELYRRAVAEKESLHELMEGIADDLWLKYFPDREPPADRLERIGALIAHLSDRHVARDEYFEEIRRQVPQLAEFVREHDLLDQDPSRPLTVRETPEYMRGSGAGASISAPGPFNPTAETYYNVTPLDAYSDAEAESYLREYNHWVLQILNIHEAIPGHYTQLLHGNKSPSLVKSLIRNGAMIEGWAVYSERMMLESGWGDQEPEMWLMYGKWNLRVVTNAILDYSVHVLGMDREEAMDLLMREAFQERTEAENKWRRVKLSQVQLTSYFTGYAEIYDFRERRKAELGDDFDLKAFHNEFLSYGNAPVPAIIRLMEE